MRVLRSAKNDPPVGRRTSVKRSSKGFSTSRWWQHSLFGAYRDARRPICGRGTRRECGRWTSFQVRLRSRRRETRLKRPLAHGSPPLPRFRCGGASSSTRSGAVTRQRPSSRVTCSRSSTAHR
jgi:hypothetical protein